jgi:hypothetical protein
MSDEAAVTRGFPAASTTDQRRRRRLPCGFLRRLAQARHRRGWCSPCAGLGTASQTRSCTPPFSAEERVGEERVGALRK